VKFGTGSGDKFHVYRGNVPPLRGEKPIFGPSKNNTGVAALCAGLPVIKVTLGLLALNVQIKNVLKHDRNRVYQVLECNYIIYLLSLF